MATAIERLYQNSPIWFQQMAVSAWGYWWFGRRFGPAFQRHVQSFRERNAWTAEQYREYQSERLRILFATAREAPFYRQAFADAGVRLGTDPWEALSRMPLLSKETLRCRPEDLLTQKRLPRGTKVFHSSGSTGTPTRTYYVPDYNAFQMAVAEVRNLNLAGATYRDRRMMIGGRKICRFDQQRPPFWRYSSVEHLVYMSAYHLSPRFMPAYIECLKRFRPDVVMGYASSLQTLAEFALATNDTPPPAKCVVPVAETLDPAGRAAMEAAWQCQVLDRYGSVEGCIFAGQCTHGRYHISPEVGFVELLDPQGCPCPPGALGEVVCTGLENTLQPLIRYRIGDVARWAAEQQCPCGQNTPILETIEGRLEDVCVTPDGRRVMRFHAVFYGLGSVQQAQVTQERVDLFVVRVVPKGELQAHDVELMKARMRQHVGPVDVRVETVSDIEKTAAGKFRAVLCKLSPEERRHVTSAA